MTDPQPIPPAVPTAPPPHRPRRSFLQVLLGLSAIFNLIFLLFVSAAFIGVFMLGGGEDPERRLDETFHSGNAPAKNKVAVVRVEGVIIEGMIDYPKKQIEQAARDPQVKAVVLRINSPGGSITASDDLHRRLTELAKGTAEHPGKPVIVSMGALAASGGYYIAMPAQKLYAERTTITGSIGVFASFPNIKKLTDHIGVKMEIIKDTGSPFKDSGSMFKDMGDHERQLWQDMVDHAYEQFLQVVRDGRPRIKDELKKVVIDKPLTVPLRDPKSNPGNYVRTRVDGGIFTADQAMEFKLIDQIGYLEDVIQDAATTAGLGDDYRAINYDRPRSLAERLLGVQSPRPAVGFDPARLADAATPRLWYLAPQSELAGMMSVAGR